MTLEEFSRLVPGTKVYVQSRGQKLSGVAGNLWLDGTCAPAVRLDIGAVAFVTEKTAHLIHLEPLN